MEENQNQDLELKYIKPEEKLYDFAINENNLDWKNFLFELIKNENLDPWNINISIFTKIYLDAFYNLDKKNFNISGKFLTIAVFLLKTKTEELLKNDIVNYSDKISKLENVEIDDLEDLEDFEDFSNNLENLAKKREKYKLDFRNPLARKKKVSIYDLVKTLEKTLSQSQIRLENFFQRKQIGKYDGPQFVRKKKDLKQIIEELYAQILQDFAETGKSHIKFSKISKDIEIKMDILEKFIPLLHLHNQGKIDLRQEKHFDEIKIHKMD